MPRIRSLHESARLINENMGLVYKLTFRFEALYDLTRDELLSNVYIQCVEISQYWDSDRSKLSTYLYRWLGFRLHKHIQNSDIIRITKKQRDKLTEQNKTIPRCFSMEGNEEKIDELNNYEQEHESTIDVLLLYIYEYVSKMSNASEKRITSIIDYYLYGKKQEEIAHKLGLSKARVQQFTSDFERNFIKEHGADIAQEYGVPTCRYHA